MLKSKLKALKMYIYSLKYGKTVRNKGVYFATAPFLSKKNTFRIIGNNVYIGRNCHIGANLQIDSNVLIASNVSFVGGDHKWNVVGTPIMFTGRDELKQINILKDVWIGHGAIIMHGVTLSEGTIVASGSVVTKDTEEYSVVAGSPAKKIRMRFTTSEIQTHKNNLSRAISK